MAEAIRRPVDFRTGAADYFKRDRASSEQASEAADHHVSGLSATVGNIQMNGLAKKALDSGSAGA